MHDGGSLYIIIVYIGYMHKVTDANLDDNINKMGLRRYSYKLQLHA